MGQADSPGGARAAVRPQELQGVSRSFSFKRILDPGGCSSCYCRCRCLIVTFVMLSSLRPGREALIDFDPFKALFSSGSDTLVGWRVFFS